MSPLDNPSPSAVGPDAVAGPVAVLRELEKKVLWLSTWMIHHANELRENPGGFKVGGHQASCASV